jgi:uncharacterized damage-inducible protein DinB
VTNEATLPGPVTDEVELFCEWLRFLRSAVLRDLADLSEQQAHWQPDGGLLSVLGVVNHLTHVEWRWIDGAFLGQTVSRSEDEFSPGPELTVTRAEATYQQRQSTTEAVVRTAGSLDAPCSRGEQNLRWVLLHLINETARHAGHADATRQLLDGTTGE